MFKGTFQAAFSIAAAILSISLSEDREIAICPACRFLHVGNHNGYVFHFITILILQSRSRF